MKGSGPSCSTPICQGGAGLDRGSCRCPECLSRRSSAQVPSLGATDSGSSPGFTPCFHHSSKISLPSLSLPTGKGTQGRLWKNCWLGWEPREAVLLPSACVSGQFFLKEGLVSRRSPGPRQVEAVLAKSQFLLGLPAGTFHFLPSSPWLWAQGGGGETQLGRPGRKDLTPYLPLSRQGWPQAALPFRSCWHLSLSLSPHLQDGAQGPSSFRRLKRSCGK